MKNQPITFGLLADLQYCDAPPFKDRFYRNSLSKLNESLKLLKASSPQFLIDLGDLIDHDEKHFDDVIHMYNQADIPVYFTLGNHDYEVSEAYKSKVPAKLHLPEKGYYTFEKAGWQFVVLNGNEISTYANLPGSPFYQEAASLLERMESDNKVNGKFYNGGISEDQLAWLRSILQKAGKENKNVLIFCHFPVYPANKHNLLNDMEVLSVLKDYPCVKAWFNGHNHQGNYGYYDNIHFINLKGIVETESDLSCCIVRLFDDRMEIEGFGRAESGKFKV